MTALLLLLRRVPLIAWIEIGIVAFILGTMGALYVHGEHVGRERERAAVLVDKLVHDTIEVHTRDTVVHRDTAHLTRVLTHYDTLRETITVTDTIAVRRFILAADSTVKACRQTVADFALSCAAKDTVIRDLRGLLALRAPPPMTWKAKLGYVITGAVLTEAAHRVH